VGERESSEVELIDQTKEIVKTYGKGFKLPKADRRAMQMIAKDPWNSTLETMCS